MRDKQRPPKLPTEDRLIRSAIHYLDRYASSTENLRRVLSRKVMKAARAHDRDPAEFQALIERVVEKCRETGLVNDQAYAETKAASLARKGRSRRGIEAWLIAKGIDRSTAETALGDRGHEDLEAARTYARRRRLGPWRADSIRADKRQNDLAALCRAGFSFQIAQQVIDGEREADD